MKMPGAPHTSRWGQAGGIYKEGLAHRPILSAQPQALPAQGPLGYLVNLGFFFFFFATHGMCDLSSRPHIPGGAGCLPLLVLRLQSKGRPQAQ